jgi:hypothetical protein
MLVRPILFYKVIHNNYTQNVFFELVEEHYYYIQKPSTGSGLQTLGKLLSQKNY